MLSSYQIWDSEDWIDICGIIKRSARFDDILDKWRSKKYEYNRLDIFSHASHDTYRKPEILKIITEC